MEVDMIKIQNELINLAEDFVKWKEEMSAKYGISEDAVQQIIISMLT